MIKCTYADRYKGLVKPRCNKGRGCHDCRTKYALLQKDQANIRSMLAAVPGVTVNRVRIRKLSSDAALANKPSEDVARGRVLHSAITKYAAKKRPRLMADDLEVSDRPYNAAASRPAKKVKSYYGGNITARQKAAHEKKLRKLLAWAEHHQKDNNLAGVMDYYRGFVSFAGKQRKPYATGSEKVDQRFLSALGKAGESGEVCNIVKKIMFREKVGARKVPKVWRDKLVSELGDDLWYFMLVLIAFNISFEEVVMGNMRKLVHRGR